MQATARWWAAAQAVVRCEVCGGVAGRGRFAVGPRWPEQAEAHHPTTVHRTAESLAFVEATIHLFMWHMSEAEELYKEFDAKTFGRVFSRAEEGEHQRLCVLPKFLRLESSVLNFDGCPEQEMPDWPDWAKCKVPS